MKIDLTEHVVARLQIFFDGVEAARSNIDAIILFVNLKRVDYPLKIVDAVFGSRHQRVAQEIVHAVNVQLRRDELRERGWMKLSLYDACDALRKFCGEGAKKAAYLCLFT